MVRRIIHIDTEKCNGCGACAEACHEGAIGMVDGKAKLLRDDYCDGLGDCLPACPTGAITFEEREAAAYDEAAVLANKKKAEGGAKAPAFGGCPGSRMQTFHRTEPVVPAAPASPAVSAAPAAQEGQVASRLEQWPVQIKLVPVQAPYFDGARLLIAADCTAYAYAGFHEKFMKDRITLVGCPKLDAIDYSEKLAEIIGSHDIQSITLVRMQVPCCGGMEMALRKALEKAGKVIPWKVVIVSPDGRLIEE